MTFTDCSILISDSPSLLLRAPLSIDRASAAVQNAPAHLIVSFAPVRMNCCMPQNGHSSSEIVPETEGFIQTSDRPGTSGPAYTVKKRRRVEANPGLVLISISNKSSKAQQHRLSMCEVRGQPTVIAYMYFD